MILAIIQRHRPPHHCPQPPTAPIADWVGIALIITAIFIAIWYIKKQK